MFNLFSSPITITSTKVIGGVMYKIVLNDGRILVHVAEYRNNLL